MISRIRGLLLETTPPSLIVDVQGVGYEIETPLSTFERLPELTQTVTLFTHLSIREDAHVLYGFLSEQEKQLFKTLIKISGVGPKLALSILSVMDLATFTQCIQENNISRLTRIPGVGKKTAERLVVEMRDRLSKLTMPSSPEGTVQAVTSTTEDAIHALIALGYKPQEASKLVHQVAEEGLTSEMLIRKALQAAL